MPNCPECKGRGYIDLLTKRVPCEACKALTVNLSASPATPPSCTYGYTTAGWHPDAAKAFARHDAQCRGELLQKLFEIWVDEVPPIS